MATQWMQDARSHAYYHVATPRSDVRDKVRFLHTQCDKQLFTSEYLRSNKASGHKNLRCFPHCCGGHNPKSFCGSGLVIECLVPNCQLVLGRFEEVAKQQPGKSDASVDTKQRHGSLVVGHDYARQELFDDVKMPDQPFGQWFRGAAVPNGTNAGTCFLLNGNRQSWHYGWQSSRLNCKNLHVFKVYVFEAHGKATTLTCVASLASPAFRISSSRKARKTFRSPAGTLLPPHVLPPATPGRDGPQEAANMDLFLANGHKPVAMYMPAPQCPPRGFLAPPDPARRERKRRTRSASLKTDYFSTVSFPRHPLHQSSQLTSLAATHPLPVATRFSMPSLPVVTDPTTDRPYHSRRSSLAALPMPVSYHRPMPVLTPITGMMHLRLESPSLFPHTVSASSSSAMGWSSGALHPYAASSARPYPFVRRDTWSRSWQTKGGEGKGLARMPLPSTVASESYLNRKRNRSTDSDKAITAAIEASEKIHPTLSPISSPGAKPVVAPVPTDSALYQRARILQLALTIVKRIHRYEEVAKPDSMKVIRHSFEMITPSVPVGPVPTKCTLVLVPLSKSKLLQLCSHLVTVCTALLASGVLEDMRQKLRDCAQAGRGILAAYQQLVDLLTEAVEAQVARLPCCKPQTNAADGSEWTLYDLLKSCEPWLVHEPWWVVLDPDTQAQAGDREEGAVRPLPYLPVFTDYYQAIHDAVPSPDDVQVAASLRKAALTGATGLTGEWNRQGELDDQHLQPPQRVASVRSATAASSLSWLARCIHAHTTKTLHVTETETTMTLSLPNSLISADAVFLVHLDQPEPTVVLPHDYFPFGWSRTRSLIAYRAWRVRGIDDANGSAVAIQFMRWPDANAVQGMVNDEEEDVDEMEAWPEEPEEEPRRRNGPLKRLRTRITMYFSVFSTTMLQLRTIVEASLAPKAVATSTKQPTEMEMRKYFKSPSSWEMRSQISQQYSKNL